MDQAPLEPQSPLEQAPHQPLDGQRDLIDQFFAFRQSPGFTSSSSVPDHLHSMARLLGLLDTPVSNSTSELLADVTIARVLRADQAAPDDSMGLSPMDEEALDALILARFDVNAVAPSLRDRAARIEAIGSSLRDSGLSAPADLTDRAIARIEAAGDARPISIESHRVRRSFRMGDLVGIAAVLLLGASVLWPMISAARTDSVRMACLSNIRTVGGGMGMYANENRDAMPVATASFGGGRWWDVGSKSRSNSANLFALAKKGFVKVEDLACPGNPGCKQCGVTPDCEDWKSLDEVSYSYQIMVPGQQPAWSRPGGIPSQTIVMADRSPVVLKIARGEAVSPDENSPNHQGLGQHALYSDGHVGWITSPDVMVGTGANVTTDNIWLPRPVEQVFRQIQAQLQNASQGAPISIDTRSPLLRGTELPTANDIFLGP